MYTASRTYRFAAAHHHDGLPPHHPQRRVHGHSFNVTLELSAPSLIEPGVIRDPHQLDEFQWFLDDTVDNHNLNRVLAFNPTLENLSRFFCVQARHMFPELQAVVVSDGDLVVRYDGPAWDQEFAYQYEGLTPEHPELKRRPYVRHMHVRARLA